MFRLLRAWVILAVTCFLCATTVSGREKPTSDVNVHGVNYSGDPFSYYVTDPAKPRVAGAGELIDPFAAGGTTCCFSLPKKWRPGIKVQVRTSHWLADRPDGTIPEIKGEHIVEVPPYANGKPGELWVLRAADGSVSVISSDFQPDHPKWPGKVKGWPVPSLEYRRERWEIRRVYEEGGVRLFQSLLDQLEKDPHARARKDWDFAQKDKPASLKGFSGPDDPRYHLFLRRDYEEGLRRSKTLLKQVMEARP